MSNRPVRLKYLKPKMKIILCIFLLYITVSVFGKPQELNGILGQSVKFPAAVKKGGYLMYRGVAIGDSSLETPGNVNYRDRVQWDSSTGFFSLSGLKMEDSGEYKVHNTDPNTIITVFQLNVYIPVSKPHVSITHNEFPCTLLCAVERGTGVTLSWYREGQKKPYVTSPVQSAPHLHLPVPVDEGGIYTCEAKNSVSRETSDPLTVGAHCTDGSSTGIIVGIIIPAVAVLIAVVFAVLHCRFIRRRRAARTLIQVKKLLDNVDLHAYDKTVPPDAVRTLIQVKKLLYYVDLHAYGIRRGIPAGRALIHVKKILDNVDPQENGVTITQDVVRTLIQVKKILDNVDPHEYGDAVQTVPQSDFKRRCHGREGMKIMTSSHETEVPLK